MNYGISFEMVDLHRQEPNRNRRESKYFWDELYCLVSAAGFDTIEIPYEPKWDFGGRSGIPLTMRSIKVKFETPQNYLSILKSSGINKMIGIHLDPSLFISSNLDMYFGAYYHYAVEAIDFAKEVSASYVTLTITPCIGDLKEICPADVKWESFSEQFLNRTAEMLRNVAKYAENKNIMLCIKNEYWSLLRGHKVVDFLRFLDSNIKLDLDTANLVIAGTDPCSIISENINIIGCVHFTDTAFVDDKAVYEQTMPEFPSINATHVFRDIGQGNIDFPAITAKLKEFGYDGSIIFNCRHTKDIYRALLRTRYYINKALPESYLNGGN
ncbi:sugar phosphate isomerase/epimerase [Clostridium sp. SYSU_GA19001]|uniref:sugar phosphate isomerase/epimerase family protein n=1 Tax=Clostridium caldaquaticum TaxID=2940653 RepID=UPI0020776964|nr:sugar phosphate isomerase/epimerase [Clostridium caldaquaticum]MCM8709960.1 sugar phosphate isomerase/epimerase [Clostridium caldaquaticum]